MIVQWRIHGLGVGDVQKIYTLGLKFRERGKFQGDVLYHNNVTLTNVELIHHLRGKKKKEEDEEEEEEGGGLLFRLLMQMLNSKCSLDPKIFISNFPGQNLERKAWHITIP